MLVLSGGGLLSVLRARSLATWPPHMIQGNFLTLGNV
jgi:hypothetical protein